MQPLFSRSRQRPCGLSSTVAAATRRCCRGTGSVNDPNLREERADGTQVVDAPHSIPPSYAILAMPGDSQIRLPLSRARIDDSPARDLPGVVDVFRCFEMVRMASFEIVEVLHDAVAPDNGAAAVRRKRRASGT